MSKNGKVGCPTYPLRFRHPLLALSAREILRKVSFLKSFRVMLRVKGCLKVLRSADINRPVSDQLFIVSSPIFIGKNKETV